MKNDRNRDQRKSLKHRLREAISRSRAYVTVTWNGKGMPVFRYDVGVCSDEKDIRHQVMQKCAEVVEDICMAAQREFEQRMNEIKQSEKVAAAKEARSKELSGEQKAD